jgi:hypothetical protein
MDAALLPARPTRKLQNLRQYVSSLWEGIAWSPRPALLTVADLAHGRRAHTAEDTPELIKERVEVADADAKFRGQAARSSVITIRHSIARPYAQAC